MLGSGSVLVEWKYAPTASVVGIHVRNEGGERESRSFVKQMRMLLGHEDLQIVSNTSKALAGAFKKS
jgi:hypothetical protein